MKVSEAYPSKHLSAADLNGQNVRVVIQNAEMEKLGDDNKPVLYFRGKQKGLVLNKTNSKTIANAYGDEMDDWNGQELILFAVMTEYQGNPVEGLRVRLPQPKDNKASVRQPSADIGRAPPKQDAMDDEIPFAPEYR